jgi:hypothetical protein
MQIAATVLDVTRKRGNSPRQGRSLESPVPGNWHAGSGKRLTEKGLRVPPRLPASLGKELTEKGLGVPRRLTPAAGSADRRRGAHR